MSSIRVLYILGSGRSGTTLLDRMLGTLPEAESAGELCNVWVRGFRNHENCGCGSPFADCPRWAAVADSVFRDGLSPDSVVDLQASVSRFRHVPQLWNPASSGEFTERLERYRTALSRLYRALSQEAGGRIVVDSSKVVPHLLVLLSMPELSVSVVHLVRDPRAVAYSWQRRRARPEVTERTAMMPTYGPVRAASEWALVNLVCQALRRRDTPLCQVRYENLIADPREQVERIATTLNLNLSQLDLDQEGQIDFPQAHTCSGNPMRFQRGRIALREDNEWRTGLSREDRAIVSMITWPARRVIEGGD